jgi:eukaryotic-like serine/threonine-protein kinase
MRRNPPAPKSGRRRLSHNRIELVEIAGHGGMSTVWRGWLYGSRSFRRSVAIKHMAPHLANDQAFCEMFYEEARIGSQLEDPNIPQVYEYVVAGHDHYIIMEYVEGINLATLIRYSNERLKQPLAWELVAAIGIGMLRGLSAAHERVDEDGQPAPIVHRDVSPHNVLISAKGPAKLIDFGLSLARDRRCGDTDPGIAKGKLPYLSPEVARGHRPGPPADQFAAGSVLWEALVGRRLFDDQDKRLAFQRLASADVPPLCELRPDVPAELQALVERAMSLPIEQRFPSTRAMAKQLGDVLKRSVTKEDLYATLARYVAEARNAMGTKRVGETPAEESISVLESGLVELVVDSELAANAAPRKGTRKSKGELPPTRVRL